MQVPHLLRKQHVTKRPWGLKPLLREESLSYLIHVNYFSFSLMFDLIRDTCSSEASLPGRRNVIRVFGLWAGLFTALPASSDKLHVCSGRGAGVRSAHVAGFQGVLLPLREYSAFPGALVSL